MNGYDARMKRLIYHLLLFVGCVVVVHALSIGATISTVTLAGGSCDDVHHPTAADSLTYRLAWYTTAPYAVLDVSYHWAYRKFRFHDTPRAQMLYFTGGMTLYGLILYLAIQVGRRIVRVTKRMHPSG